MPGVAVEMLRAGRVANRAGASRRRGGLSVKCAAGSAVKVVERRARSSGDTGMRAGAEDAERVRHERLESARAAAEASLALGGAELHDPALFESTPAQVALCSAYFGTVGALGAQAVAGVVHGDAGALEVLTSALAAYWLSDLGTGIFHWSVDNYGSKATPLVGGVVDGFQGHHRYPWTITKRQFANNVHIVCTPPFAVVGPALLAPIPPSAKMFVGVFGACVVLSQQFHAWSHLKPSQMHPAVRAAQNAGLILSTKAHGQHHRSPFAGNYCIVSGWWNNLLDDSGFFRKLEGVVHEATGIAPRCWTEADFSIEEDAPEGWDKDGLLR